MPVLVHSDVKTVLMIVQNNSYPFDNRVYRESKSLNNAGYRVLVISPKSTMDNQLYENLNGIEVFRYTNYLSDGSFIGFAKEYINAMFWIYSLSIKLLIKKNISIIHVANPPDVFWPLALIGRSIGKKFIYDQHDMSPEMYNIRFGRGMTFRLLQFFEYMSVKTANAVFVTNESFILRSQSLWRLSPNKYTVLFNGPLRSFSIRHNQHLAAQYNAFSVILYIGLMSKNDNIENVIEAAKRIIASRGTDIFRFILLGSGDVEEKMKIKAKEYGILESVEFKGYVDQQSVMEYLDIAEICIAPDLPNGMNEKLTHVKVLEYMKAGKPFVGFKLDETMKIAGESGLFAETIDDFTEKILFLHDNPLESERLGNVGRNKVEKEYLWEYSEKLMLETYQKLLS